MVWIQLTSGWFGFNAGSALAAGSQAAYAALATEISAAVALTTWVGIEWIRGGKPGISLSSLRPF
jgi:Amt family ammonium transporter